MKTFTTKSGSNLPLMNLKGKDYLLVAYRIQWLNEEKANFMINTDFLSITDDQTVARAVVNIYDENGKVLKSATATKRETKKDFPDHTEKAETGAVGRALAMLGFGTQFAIADLDEGNRLADAPLAAPQTATVTTLSPKVVVTAEEKSVPARKAWKKKTEETTTSTKEDTSNWG